MRGNGRRKRLAKLAQLDRGSMGVCGKDPFRRARELQEEGVVFGEEGEVGANGYAPGARVICASGMGRILRCLAGEGSALTLGGCLAHSRGVRQTNVQAASGRDYQWRCPYPYPYPYPYPRGGGGA